MAEGTPSGSPGSAVTTLGGNTLGASPGTSDNKVGNMGSEGDIGAVPGQMTGSSEKPTISGMESVKQMIIQHEGVRNRPYQDSLGLWTVGVGHLIGDGKSLPPNMNREFSQKEINDLFENDFAKHYSIAERTPGWPIANESGKGAMVDLAFNMGQWWNKFPNTSKSLEKGDFVSAATGLKDSLWYKQVGQRGKKITSLIAEGGPSQNGTGKGAEATQLSSTAVPIQIAQAEAPITPDSTSKKMQSAQIGGILYGDMSGYQAMLHGTEAVVPLPDGKSIPVNMPEEDNESAVLVSLLSEKVQKLTLLVDGMSKHMEMSRQLLQLQS